MVDCCAQFRCRDRLASASFDSRYGRILSIDGGYTPW